MAHDSPSSRLFRRDRSVMPRQRTGSHFQRQSNIAEPIGVAPDRPLNYGTCVPCLGSFYLAAWPPSPVGHVHHQCRRPSRTLAHLWQLLPTKATHLPARHFAAKGTRCGQRFSSITRKNPRSVGPNQVTTKRFLCRNEKTQPTYTTRLTENIHKTTCRGLCVFPGDC